MTVEVKKSYKIVKADEGLWILNINTLAIAKKVICGLKVNVETNYREIDDEEKERIEEEIRRKWEEEFPGPHSVPGETSEI